jgi:hypothetical protein
MDLPDNLPRSTRRRTENEGIVESYEVYIPTVGSSQVRAGRIAAISSNAKVD